MRKNKYNILLILITLGLFSLNFTPVFAQQMLIQILGGGYRLYGTSIITFPAQTASVTGDQTSEISVRDIQVDTDPLPGYILISDYNGGQAFNVTVSATTLTRQAGTEEIPLSNFMIKNTSSVGNTIDTINGRDDGLTLNAATNSYATFESTRALADGTGQAPGEWKIYPTLQITIPEGQRSGTYESTLTFTIT
jgi:hypothetical protein